MKILSIIITSIVMLEHIWFLILEMFLWNTPMGIKVFKLTPEFALQSKALAANQGLYNGFLAAGLLWGLVHKNPEIKKQLLCFFLGCIFIAGVFGAATVSPRIFYMQAVPALLALVLNFIVQRKNT
jgi:putative membrane protein